MRGASICWGDVELDKIGINSGKYFSTYKIQDGQQLVNMGNGPPFLIRCISSFASSTIVRSAPKTVSKTLSQPNSLREATSFPSQKVPAGIPNSSAKVKRTEGAV